MNLSVLLYVKLNLLLKNFNKTIYYFECASFSCTFCNFFEISNLEWIMNYNKWIKPEYKKHYSFVHLIIFIYYFNCKKLVSIDVSKNSNNWMFLSACEKLFEKQIFCNMRWKFSK